MESFRKRKRGYVFGYYRNGGTRSPAGGRVDGALHLPVAQQMTVTPASLAAALNSHNTRVFNIHHRIALTAISVSSCLYPELTYELSVCGAMLADISSVLCLRRVGLQYQNTDLNHPGHQNRGCNLGRKCCGVWTSSLGERNHCVCVCACVL